jgi:hypothetical protein
MDNWLQTHEQPENEDKRDDIETPNILFTGNEDKVRGENINEEGIEKPQNKRQG